ncbi:MAG: SDR family NAD(P)-dependent oxidoreductase [Solirubrobacteraceae bacterium]
MDLHGTTCLVTGANRGIGLAIARRLAQEPVRLLVGVRELDRYEPVDAQGATEVRPVVVDVGSREAIEASLAGLAEERVDVLVNNAGGFTAGLLETQDLDAIYDTVQATLLGSIHLTRALLPGMLARGRGKVVCCSSIVAYLHVPGVTTYSAAKAGLSGFAECLRRELADTPVSTLHVVTGGIDTDMLDTAKAELERHYDTSTWTQYEPGDWAEKVVSAIEADDDVLGPGGKAAIGKLAAHLPPAVLDTLSGKAFDREP